MAPLVNEVKIWNKWELGAAHEISPPDLYDEFDMRLSDEIEHLQEVKASRKLNDAEAKWLQTCENKKHSLRIVDNKRQWTQSLAAWCNILSEHQGTWSLSPHKRRNYSSPLDGKHLANCG